MVLQDWSLQGMFLVLLWDAESYNIAQKSIGQKCANSQHKVKSRGEFICICLKKTLQEVRLINEAFQSGFVWSTMAR